MRFFKFLAAQILIFFAVTLALKYTVLPFDSWLQPSWAITFGYGGLFLLPFIINRENIRALVGIGALLLVWLSSIALKLTGDNFIGHVPALYLAVAFLCVFLHGFTCWRPMVIKVAVTSVLMSFVGTVLVEMYGIRADLPIGAVLLQNFLHLIQLTVVSYGERDGPSFTAKKRDAYPQTFEHKKAA